tara:strand:- start:12413 stop:13303 length:891 start_codon:yes stop_codon:yes gene_type:complete
MAEFVVMTAGCLLLLFVLVPVVAKMTDMAYKSQEVARYTAWERTVWYGPNGGRETTPTQIDTSEGHLATRSDAQIFNSAEHRILSFKSTADSFDPQDISADSSTQSNHFWRWTHGQGKSMLSSGEMPDNSTLRNERTPSTAYAILDSYNDVMGGVAKVVSILSFGQGDEDFLQVAHPIHNFYKSEVELPVSLAGSKLGSQDLFPEHVRNLDIKARSAVLADGWVAQSDSHFHDKAGNFVLGTAVENNPIWKTLRGIIGIFEPSFKEIDFAPVNTDPMPDTDFDCNQFTGYCYFAKD